MHHDKKISQATELDNKKFLEPKGEGEKTVSIALTSYVQEAHKQPGDLELEDFKPFPTKEFMLLYMLVHGLKPMVMSCTLD